MKGTKFSKEMADMMKKMPMKGTDKGEMKKGSMKGSKKR